MKCPSCGQQAIGMLRFCTAFTRGVSYSQAIKGYFKCRNCGTLLHITGFNAKFWMYIGFLIAVFIGYWILLPRITQNMGLKGSIGILLVWFVFVIYGIIYVRWKNVRINKT